MTTNAAPSTSTEDRAATGVAGLDDILGGGLPTGHLYLLEGEPGAGKTTLGMQFLLAGRSSGETTLYITLSETVSELRQVGRSHGWDLSGIELRELSTMTGPRHPASQYTVFSPTEVELDDTLGEIHQVIKEIKPQRIVFDSLSEMRLLSRDQLRFRREILNLKQFFSEHGATVLLLDDCTADPNDRQLHSICHGIIVLERIASNYGVERRRAAVTKLRATTYRGGYHDYRIRTGGLCVFPRLIASEHERSFEASPVMSGSEHLDQLLGGGLSRGTTTMLLGPVGCGKSTLAAMYAFTSAVAGEQTSIFLFDEHLGTMLTRCKGLEISLDQQIATGNVVVRQIDPGSMSPGEFIQVVRDSVEQGRSKHILIDSVAGFMNAMPGEPLLSVLLHELHAYLNQLGVNTFMTMPQHGVLGTMPNYADLSYLADNLILLRYFEAHGEVRKAISVVKKRTGSHEHTIREMRLGQGGVQVGEPLREFRGVLTGVPVYVGKDGPLLPRTESDLD